MMQLLPFLFFFAEPRTLHYLGDEDQFYRSTSHYPFQEKNAKNAGKPRPGGHFHTGFLKLALFFQNSISQHAAHSTQNDKIGFVFLNHKGTVLV
jgi:membrane-associated PAP2 superfamily phosphatase